MLQGRDKAPSQRHRSLDDKARSRHEERLTEVFPVGRALAVAYFIVRTRSRVLRVLTLVVLLVPFLMGEIVRTFAWYLILANRGAPGWFVSLFGVESGGILGTPLAVFIGMLQVSVPLAALLILPAVRRIDPDLERVAATLGASPGRVWRHVLIPLAWPGLAAATVIVLLLNVAEYDMPAILGMGRLPFVANVIGGIYTLQQNLSLGSAFSLVLLAISTVSIQTLPIAMFAGLRGPPPPEVAAAAGLYVVAALFVVLTLTSLKSTEQFFYRAD